MDTPEPADAAPQAAEVDLAAIAADLVDVEVALARLDAGTYFSDEVTGQALPGELLAAHPTARRLPIATAPAPGDASTS